ncbi:hypothetical protein KI387_040732, partial [Taxus chinensis]
MRGDDLLRAHNESANAVILHGSLNVSIFEARALPNMDLSSERLRQFFSVFSACRAPFRKSKHQCERQKIITSDPYVSVNLADAKVAQTRIIKNSQHPIWNEHFTIQVAHLVAEVCFVVKDDDLMGADLIGTVAVSAQRVFRGEKIEDWFPVLGANGQPPKPDAALRISMEFTPAETNPLYQFGVGSGPNYHGVPHTYFPLRKGGMITLYQDAHGEDNPFLNIRLEDGSLFERKKCWEDICHAILEAHHLVYIAGWSIYTKIKLIREPTRPLPLGGDLTLGDLLKFKSQEGVRVLLLIWDDKTSHDNIFIKT